MSRGLRFFRTFTILSAGVACLLSAVPAYALSTNTLLFEKNVVGTGPGGNLTDTQIQTLADQNELEVGWPAGEQIEVIGKINVGGLFEPATGFIAANFVSFDCNPVGAGGNDADCQTGFTVNFDFTGLSDEWQIVKVAVKAGQQDVGVFFIDPALLQSGDLDPLQAGFVPDAERLESCGSAINNPNNANDDGCRGVSNIIVFGTRIEDELNTPKEVPEPTTLILLGLGLVGAGFARKLRK